MVNFLYSLLGYMGARLREPSTWAGLAIVLGTGLLTVVPPQWRSVLQDVVVLAGGAAVVAPERNS